MASCLRWKGLTRQACGSERRIGMSEENVDILRKGYEAFNRADIDTVVGLMNPEIE